ARPPRLRHFLKSALILRAAAGQPARRLGRLSPIPPQVILSLVRLLDGLLHAIGQSLSHPVGEVRTVPPSPDLHGADAEEPRRRPRAAEHHPEQPIKPTAGDFSLEA